MWLIKGTSPLQKCKNQQLCSIKQADNQPVENIENVWACVEATHISDIFDIREDFNVIQTIYERSDRGVYVIRLKTKIRLLKVKLVDDDDTNELRIHKILKCAHNRYIIKFVDYGINSVYKYFVYEYFPGQTLAEYIQNVDIHETDIKKIFKKIVKAVQFLHSKNIIHCDLKLDNILIDNKGIVKIIDFDLSKVCDAEYISTDIFGTMQYIAPESYDLRIYSKKSDVWGLGIILYILITKTLPYETDFPIVNSYDNMYRRNTFKHPNLSTVTSVVKKKKYSKNVVKLIKHMLAFEDTKRISIAGILASKWLKTDKHITRSRKKVDF